ncbi:putative integral membrane protein (TIGR00698 family) [Weissella beninensis]|uniref:Sulfate exporter family transporter n=1 Tax=Periweissella beninensis TaxID=504936 RepID=A0ABT0VJS8_9LACO|nr:putative sulfate exporter family transporter [Periweissella beninensis]MBM7544587.1 putative integral membrane protein (TIGR00698 family) [Periweissella beninensis]MCM2438086.1 putative sulfate exporter family transporter [Periweissella beninensis]
MKIKKNMVNGIIVTLVLALFAKYLAVFLPKLGPESLAMLLGILLGNTIFANQKFAAGIKWAEKYPIEIGIALMGLTVTFTTIKTLGVNGIAFILIQMIVTICLVLYLGKYVFKVSKKESMLMGAGNAVCGSSAIAAVAPTIGADDNQRRTTVATVSLTGVLLLLILPIMGPHLFGNHNLLLGALVGGTVQSVGQVVGTASLINATVVTYATLFKMLRIIMLTFVVLVFARMAQKENEQTRQKNGVIGQSQKIKVPWFIIVFALFLIINSLTRLPKGLTLGASNIASFFGIVNLAGIGLNLKFKTIKNSGLTFLSYGFVIGILQVLLALILIKILF